MRLSIILLVLLFFMELHAQQTFNNRYHFDFPAAVLTSVLSSDSGYYATGIIADSLPPHKAGAIFLRIDQEGEPELINTLKSPTKTYEPWYNGLHRLQNGNFILQAGSVDSVRKSILIVFNPFGDTLFTKEYFHPNYPNFEYIQPRGGFSLAPDGGFVLSHWIDAPGHSDIYLVKTDSAGNKKWGKVFGNSMWDRPQSLLVTPEGKIIVGAIRTNDNTAVENYIYRCHIFQVDENGTLEWDYLTPTSLGLFDAANDMVLLEDGSIVVASGAGTELERSSVNAVWFDKLLFKLSTGGEIEWCKKFEEPELTSAAEMAKVVKASNNSGFVAAGTSGEDLPGQNTFVIRGWVGKVTLQGDSLWTREYVVLDNNNSRHKIYDMKECPDGGFILCGESRDASGMSTIPQQAWLLKLDEHGCLIPGCHLPNDVEEMHAEKPELVIYPNPVRDYLNFQLRHAGPVQHSIIRILDAEGRLMRSFSAIIHPGETIIIPVWDWTPGVYFLQCLNDDKGIVAVKKFVVK